MYRGDTSSRHARGGPKKKVDDGYQGASVETFCSARRKLANLKKVDELLKSNLMRLRALLISNLPR